MQEWQAQVLAVLWEWEDEHHFRDNAYTLSAMTKALIVRRRLWKFNTLRQYLGELKKHGVLVQRGFAHDGRRRDRGTPLYVFDGGKAEDYLSEEFDRSTMGVLLKEHVFLMRLRR